MHINIYLLIFFLNLLNQILENFDFHLNLKICFSYTNINIYQNLYLL